MKPSLLYDLRALCEREAEEFPDGHPEREHLLGIAGDLQGRINEHALAEVERVLRAGKPILHTYASVGASDVPAERANGGLVVVVYDVFEPGPGVDVLRTNDVTAAAQAFIREVGAWNVFTLLEEKGL
jgi:hypothetical protein